MNIKALRKTLVAEVKFQMFSSRKIFGQFITSRQLFLAIKLIAFLYISNSKCTGTQLWNSQTEFMLKKKHYSKFQLLEVEKLSVGCVICALPFKRKLDLLKQNRSFKDGSKKVERTIHIYLETESEFFSHNI